MLEKLQLGLASVLVIGGALASSIDCAIAQLVPDSTLGAESSVVTPQVPGSNVDLIQGGATRGTNLFHSFEQFSVLTGEAFFNNALDIQNIISRVTGASGSNIDGLIRANGTANLFLLNPNGIIFGPNASLSIGGSFVGSTASSVNFADGTVFSAIAPQSTSLLTVSVPLGLQFGATVGDILNQSRVRSNNQVGLQVPPGRSLALVGGDVTLDSGRLTAPDGRIELGGLSGAGTVGMTFEGNNPRLDYPNEVARADVSLTNAARADASGQGGGAIQVQGRRVRLTGGSQIRNQTLGSTPGGTLSVTATELVDLIGAGGLIAEVRPGATGRGSDVTIETQRLTIQDGALVSTTTGGQGAGGNLEVNASESVEFIGMGVDGETSSGLIAEVRSGATGRGSDVTIETQRLTIQDGAWVSTTTGGQGAGGNLEVNASESVELIGIGVDGESASGLSAEVRAGATGRGSNITIKTQRLIIQDGARISTATRDQGAGGNLEVNASESVELIGTQTSSTNSTITVFRSGLFSAVTELPDATGNGGNLTVETRHLSIRDGATVTASTNGPGDAGDLTVRASESVELSGTSADPRLPNDNRLGRSSSLRAETTSTGNAGNLRIETGQLTVRDGVRNIETGQLRPQVSVSSSTAQGGSAGNLEIAARSIRLDNQGSIQATTDEGNQGNIRLDSQDLVLRNGSFITTNAYGTATGGNITIDTGVIVAFEDSDISANADESFGGRIRIEAQDIFGTEFRSNGEDTLESDITASSNLGPQFSGIVEINTPDVDPNQGLVTLPAELIDASNQIAQGCASGVREGESKFIVTGRGGLPPSPDEPLSGESVLSNWITLDHIDNYAGAASSNEATTEIVPAQIVEANGWAIASDGKVILTAAALNVTPTSSGLIPNSCNGS